MRHLEAELGGGARPRLKLVSDIDDTLFASQHDRSYPHRRQPYPGARAFHYAFGLKRPIWDLVAFLTARPEGVDGAARRQTRAQLDQVGYGRATLLMAEVEPVDLVRDKLANYRAYRQFYPDYR